MIVLLQMLPPPETSIHQASQHLPSMHLEEIEAHFVNGFSTFFLIMLQSVRHASGGPALPSKKSQKSGRTAET